MSHYTKQLNLTPTFKNTYYKSNELILHKERGQETIRLNLTAPVNLTTQPIVFKIPVELYSRRELLKQSIVTYFFIYSIEPSTELFPLEICLTCDKIAFVFHKLLCSPI